MKSTGLTDAYAPKSDYLKTEVQRLQDMLKKKSTEYKQLFARFSQVQSNLLEKEEEFTKYQQQVKRTMAS